MKIDKEVYNALRASELFDVMDIDIDEVILSFCSISSLWYLL